MNRFAYVLIAVCGLCSVSACSPVHTNGNVGIFIGAAIGAGIGLLLAQLVIAARRDSAEEKLHRDLQKRWR